MAQQTRVIILLALFGGCEGRSPTITDPIAEVPITQQRTITRSEFAWRWPFAVGGGTLGCVAGAVVFRAGNTSYGLNDAANAKGFASVTPLQVTEHPEPRNPLPGINQDARMQIFAQAVACERTANDDRLTASACRQRLRDAHRLAEDQLKQIEAEGAERRWPPLSPQYRSLAPVVEAGLKLCAV